MQLKYRAVIYKVTLLQVPDSICRSYWVRCYGCSHDYNPFIFFYVRLGIPCISVNHKIDTFHALTSIRQLHFIISSNLHTGYVPVMTHHSASNLKQIVGSQLRFQVLARSNNIAFLSNSSLQNLAKLLTRHMRLFA